jgi:SAM-dependent methyltransferase
VLHQLHSQVAGEAKPGLPSGQVRRDVECFLLDRYLSLGRIAAGLPLTERGAAQLKLHESLTAARRLGLLGGLEPAEPTESAEPAGLGLFWYSEAHDVLEQAGPEALVHTLCGVCGGMDRRLMFHHQGFAYYRCLECTHVYVSPRVSADVQTRMLAELEDAACEDQYLDIQRIYAERICALLRNRTPGHRLLDVGFGRGYLMRVAQAYGFEVHGIEGSPAQVATLAPQFGDRILHCVLGQDAIPWQGLDAVVMSHILEHLHDPHEILTHIRERMSPGGWIYVAVPDMGSSHFKILGRRWDAISPLTHLQYFTEASLSRLLSACSFEDVERVHHPAADEDAALRWRRLMGQVGGSENSELTLVARNPNGSRGNACDH